MVWPANIISNRLRCPSSYKNRACMSDFLRDIFGVTGANLQMLGSYPIRQIYRLINTTNHKNGPVILPGRAGDVNQL